MTVTWHTKTARDMGSDPHRLAGHIADTLGIVDPTATALLVDCCTAVMVHKFVTVSDIARRYLGDSPKQLRHQFYSAGLPSPQDVVTLIRLCLWWLYIEGHEVTVAVAAYAVGFSEAATPSKNLHRLTGFRPTAARHEPVTALIERWGSRTVQPRPVAATTAGAGQFHLFPSLTV
jgi:AraC-like DNA-binding protein